MLPLLGPQSVLVDVNTVKAHPARLLRQHAGGRTYVTSHPSVRALQFSEKQGQSLSGLRLVLTDHTLPAGVDAALIAWLKDLGLNVLTMTPDAHDRMLAETLFLTHYIGQAVARGRLCAHRYRHSVFRLSDGRY